MRIYITADSNGTPNGLMLEPETPAEKSLELPAIASALETVFKVQKKTDSITIFPKRL